MMIKLREALSYQRLIDEFSYDHALKFIGKSEAILQTV